MSILLLMLMTGVAVTSGTAAMALYYRYSRDGDEDGAPSLLLAAHTASRDALNLRPGDAVVHMDQTYIVQGRMEIVEAGAATFDRVHYPLNSGDQGPRRWLIAHRGDRTHTALLDPAPGLDFDGKPPTTLTHDGASYKLTAWLQATTAHLGDVGRAAREDRVELHIYAALGDRALMLARWDDGTTDAWAGRACAPEHLEFLPGESDNAAPRC